MVFTTAVFPRLDQLPLDQSILSRNFSFHEIPAEFDLDTLQIRHRSDAFGHSGTETDKSFATPLDRLRESNAEARSGHVVARHYLHGQDIDRIFSVQTERVVRKDNTVEIGDRSWQIERTPWRGTLAGCRVTICEHLDGRVSIVYGPHVVGRYRADGTTLHPVQRKTPHSKTAVRKGRLAANLSRPTGSFG